MRKVQIVLTLTLSVQWTFKSICSIRCIIYHSQKFSDFLNELNRILIQYYYLKKSTQDMHIPYRSLTICFYYSCYNVKKSSICERTQYLIIKKNVSVMLYLVEFAPYWAKLVNGSELVPAKQVKFTNYILLQG